MLFDEMRGARLEDIIKPSYFYLPIGDDYELLEVEGTIFVFDRGEFRFKDPIKIIRDNEEMEIDKLIGDSVHIAQFLDYHDISVAMFVIIFDSDAVLTISWRGEDYIGVKAIPVEWHPRYR